MAVIPRIVNKGTCWNCFGTGWEPKIEERKWFEEKTHRANPVSFDIGKCQICGGIGKIYELYCGESESRIKK